MNRNPVLPVDAILPNVVASLQQVPNLVIEAPPGAGKTTRVPPALLDIVRGQVVVLEPRRIAARMAARRVADEMGEKLGATVGYQVRFDEVAGPSTRLRFVTEGVLTRRLIRDPTLHGIGAVVLDEFHERHLDGDLALALLKRLQKRRPDLLIVVMSATLETDPVARYLGGCPVIRSQGRLFDLSIAHLPYSPEPLEAQMRTALEILLNEAIVGDILAFLPGAAEIRRTMNACGELARRAGRLVLPLHGSLSAEEQDRAVAPASKPKLILSTNVAESSITIDGVTAVIDSGLARLASWSPWTGFQTLRVGRVSKASAQQRAGRAGRTGPGRVIRTYPSEDYARRPDHDTPEIVRGDLSQVCLALRAMGMDPIHDVEWLDRPPEASLATAESLLDRLGATGEVARHLARFPLAPRLSRILSSAMEQGIAGEGVIAAAVLGSEIAWETNELLTAMDQRHDPRLQHHIFQLRRMVERSHPKRDSEDALLRSVLAGYPDRVAKRRAGNQILLSSGGSAEVRGEMPPYPFMVAVDAEERAENPMPLVRMVSRIEPEWLLDLFPDRVREESRLSWNRGAERVEAASVLLYDELVIQESRDAKPDMVVAAELLANNAMEAGIERFVDRDQLDSFFARVKFAGLSQPDLRQAVQELCKGILSFAELQSAAKKLIQMLEQGVGARQLQELAPTSLRLPGRRQAPIHYASERTPWIASRIQDFFGMRETPRIGRDRTPLVVHLLAPNRRPVQTTTDLAGFWERLYPQVRRELMRSYPRHSWPEKP
ncbi:MAG: ATP-dependent helicase HrpB [Acidobacteriota bacterium]